MSAEYNHMETDRLVLRPLVQEHFEELKGILSEPNVVKTLVGDASTPEAVETSCELWISDPSFWEANGFGFWGVFDTTGEFGTANDLLGVVGADEPPPVVGEGPEIYYFFAPHVWKKGVGGEAVRGMCDYLFNSVNLPALEALIFAELNPGSVRIAEKVGMRNVGRLPLVGHHLSGERARDTMQFDIWRVSNSSPERAEHTLSEAVFRIGQLLAENAWSRGDAISALLNASKEAGLIANFGEQYVGDFINTRLAEGGEAKGISHYRVRKNEYYAHQKLVRRSNV